MKKIIISILICYFIMFSLVGCTKNKNNFSIGKREYHYPLKIKH